MKVLSKSCLILIFILTGCKPTGLNGSYKDLGEFESRIEAQNQAITNILDQYNSLPQNDYYKVRYSVRNSAPTERSENALWYHKELSSLALEQDIHSGAVCRWQEVSKVVLEQAIRSANSLIKIDSLSKPNQPFRQCL
ncbi:hypothetical protein SAMN05216167_102608 [Spirosoma endophyticum]|uniref:Lipoprotein n=1 Tax=Spirosoma endophyticum TaxID=662367 RepID=A0A1I1MK66_9BACT|nr:hypothetical protein SAMN05216167_102608 [Spirosoma endophyticum]